MQLEVTMAVLPSHSLVWLKPHRGKLVGQPLTFRDKAKLANIARLAAKGLIGKADENPSAVAEYNAHISKSAESVVQARKVLADRLARHKVEEEAKRTAEMAMKLKARLEQHLAETTPPEAEVEETQAEVVAEVEKPKKKSKKSKKGVE